jgi:tetratricopeptide (TPR) repeat protein
MVGNDGGSSGSTGSRIQQVLASCVDWSRQGQHRRIISEITRLLEDSTEDDRVRAALLTWEAQAHLSMGKADKALPAASLSWELDPSPHACHLKSSALEALGDAERSEELLRMGWRLFPEAIHLPVQLAVTLAGQARMPEALDILDEVDVGEQAPEDIRVFLCGTRANLLASMGRWAEADEELRHGLGTHPESRLLEEARAAVHRAQRRERAEKRLAASWREGLQEIEGIAAEVEDAVRDCCAVNEIDELVELAARRLWRAFQEATHVRPHAPVVWGTAVVLAALELDGETPNAACYARSFGARPVSVRSALRRLRSYVKSLNPEFRQRAFAAHANPRLVEGEQPRPKRSRQANVIPFPRT